MSAEPTPPPVTVRLGVDTGGTFTDVVRLDPAGRITATCKLPSTPHDPGQAVLAGIRQILPPPPPEVSPAPPEVPSAPPEVASAPPEVASAPPGVSSAPPGASPTPAPAPGNNFPRATDPGPGLGHTPQSASGHPEETGDLAQVEVVHGSTVATNALLEGKTARMAFVTTAGFEDTLHIARQNRPDLYARVPRRPDPPVPRARCLGVPERMAHDGSVIRALEAGAADDLAKRLLGLKVESVAVSLLHSYANPDHERRIAQAIRRGLGDAVHLTVSHELLPTYREYERGSTCAVNAAVGPVMSRYLGRLSGVLGPGRLRVMGSDGGTLSPAAACAQPVRTVLSGPAGGVLGALAAAKAAGIDRIITFDMGGTSTDVSLCDGKVTLTTEGDTGGGSLENPAGDRDGHAGDRPDGASRSTEKTSGGGGGGMPVRLPMVDIHTVGAGGGSIAWVDPGGALRVGPQSAGAEPGPACYGRQPTDQPPVATVTDAHVVLGHLAPGAPLGSGLRVRADLARRAIADLARRIGLAPAAAAEGVLQVAEAAMSRAIAHVSLQRGHDPRPLTLVTFGGAGGLHAARLAEGLGIRRVLVPAHPGLLSAAGMLTAPPRRTASRSLRWVMPAGGPAPDLAGVLGRLAGSITADPGQAPVRHTYTVDLRYAGQSYEIPIDAQPGADPAGLLAAFHAEHERLYGYRDPARPVELVAARCMADGPTRALAFGAGPAGARGIEGGEEDASGDASGGTSESTSGGISGGTSGGISGGISGGGASAGRVTRCDLSPGTVVTGPRVITEYSATTLVPAGWVARAQAPGHLLLERAS